MSILTFLLIVFVLFVFFIIVAIIAPSYTWGHKVALGIDILGAVFIWGTQGITISSYTAVYACRGAKWAILLRALLNHLDSNHCTKAIQYDIDRCQADINKLKEFQIELNQVTSSI